MGRMLECSKLTFSLLAKGIKLTNLFSGFQKQVKPYSPTNFPSPQFFIKISYFFEIFRIYTNSMLGEAGLDLLLSVSGVLSGLLTTGNGSSGVCSETVSDFGVFPLAIFVDMNSFFLLLSNYSFRRRYSSAFGLIPRSRLSREERILLNFSKNLLFDGVTAILESESAVMVRGSSAGWRCMSDSLIQNESVGLKDVSGGLVCGQRVMEEYRFGRWRRHDEGLGSLLIGSILMNITQDSETALTIHKNLQHHFPTLTNPNSINFPLFCLYSDSSNIGPL